jgi:hypothetical protein
VQISTEYFLRDKLAFNATLVLSAQMLMGQELHVQVLDIEDNLSPSISRVDRHVHLAFLEHAVHRKEILSLPQVLCLPLLVMEHSSPETMKQMFVKKVHVASAIIALKMFSDMTVQEYLIKD